MMMMSFIMSFPLLLLQLSPTILPLPKLPRKQRPKCSTSEKKRDEKMIMLLFLAGAHQLIATQEPWKVARKL
jgi:hypothetical protein